MKTKEISFTNQSDLQLSGVLHEPDEGAESVVILAHGFCSNKSRSRYIETAKAFAEAGIATLRFDFGGSGQSDKRAVTIEGEVDDLKSAVAEMKKEGYQYVGLLGESLGGVVSLKTYSEDINAMVLWAPVTKSQKLGLFDNPKHQEELKENGYIIRHKDDTNFKIPQQFFNELENIDRNALFADVDIPIRIIHGNNDDAVPIQHSEEALTYLPKNSKLVVIDNAGHVMKGHAEKLIQKTVEWFVDQL